MNSWLNLIKNFGDMNRAVQVVLLDHEGNNKISMLRGGQPGVPGTPIAGSAWQIRDRPAAGVAASVTQAAPGENKRLVVVACLFTARSNLVSINLGTYVEVVDGAGAVLFDAVFGIKGTLVNDMERVAANMLVAGVNQSVTIRFGGGATNLAEAVAASGYAVDVS